MIRVLLQSILFKGLLIVAVAGVLANDGNDSEQWQQLFNGKDLKD